MWLKNLKNLIFVSVIYVHFTLLNTCVIMLCNIGAACSPDDEYKNQKHLECDSHRLQASYFYPHYFHCYNRLQALAFHLYFFYCWCHLQALAFYTYFIHCYIRCQALAFYPYFSQLCNQFYVSSSSLQAYFQQHCKLKTLLKKNKKTACILRYYLSKPLTSLSRSFLILWLKPFFECGIPRSQDELWFWLFLTLKSNPGQETNLKVSTDYLLL
jgi:hypothetical protein